MRLRNAPPNRFTVFTGVYGMRMYVFVCQCYIENSLFRGFAAPTVCCQLLPRQY
jgi:hypothetical protein